MLTSGKQHCVRLPGSHAQLTQSAPQCRKNSMLHHLPCPVRLIHNYLFSWLPHPGEAKTRHLSLGIFHVDPPGFLWLIPNQENHPVSKKALEQAGGQLCSSSARPWQLCGNAPGKGGRAPAWDEAVFLGFSPCFTTDFLWGESSSDSVSHLCNEDSRADAPHRGEGCDTKYIKN